MAEFDITSLGQMGFSFAVAGFCLVKLNQSLKDNTTAIVQQGELIREFILEMRASRNATS